MFCCNTGVSLSILHSEYLQLFNGNLHSKYRGEVMAFTYDLAKQTPTYTKNVENFDKTVQANKKKSPTLQFF